MEFKVGKSYKAKLRVGAPYRIRVLAIVDDDQIVFKWYGRHKQWWHYEVCDAELLEIKCERAGSDTTPSVDRLLNTK